MRRNIVLVFRQIRGFLQRNRIFIDVLGILVYGFVAIVISYAALSYQKRESIKNEYNFQADIWLDIQKLSGDKPSLAYSYTIRNDGFRTRDTWYRQNETYLQISVNSETTRYNGLPILFRIPASGFFDKGPESFKIRDFKKTGPIATYVSMNIEDKLKFAYNLIKNRIGVYNKRNNTRLTLDRFDVINEFYISYDDYLDKTNHDMFVVENASLEYQKFDRIEFYSENFRRQSIELERINPNKYLRVIINPITDFDKNQNIKSVDNSFEIIDSILSSSASPSKYVKP